MLKGWFFSVNCIIFMYRLCDCRKKSKQQTNILNFIAINQTRSAAKDPENIITTFWRDASICSLSKTPSYFLNPQQRFIYFFISTCISSPGQYFNKTTLRGCLPQISIHLIGGVLVFQVQIINHGWLEVIPSALTIFCIYVNFKLKLKLFKTL